MGLFLKIDLCFSVHQTSSSSTDDNEEPSHSKRHCTGHSTPTRNTQSLDSNLNNDFTNLKLNSNLSAKFCSNANLSFTNLSFIRPRFNNSNQVSVLSAAAKNFRRNDGVVCSVDKNPAELSLTSQLQVEHPAQEGNFEIELSNTYYEQTNKICI